MNTLMDYRGYHASIEYDAEDRIFVGSVIGIQDSLSFHGSSISELEDMFHQSIDNYLEHCKEIGKIPDKEYKGSFNIRISSVTHRIASLQAEREHISLNQLVVNAVNEYLKVHTA